MLHPPAHGTPGFNGATAFRQWKRHPRSLWSSVRATRFNGATAFRQWKPSNVAVMRLRPCSVLQWGHHLSAVETSAAYPAGHRRLRASMGPPPFGSGNRAYVASTRARDTGLQWGHRLSAVETPSPIPVVLCSCHSLQWGHRLSAVETFKRRRDAPAPLLGASMGPPPFGSGNECSVSSRASPITCFNGATAFRQWKPQWGHRLSAVETVVFDAMSRPFAELQWGHRLSAVETMTTYPVNLGVVGSFNGATAFRQWKLSPRSITCSPQWGHRMFASMGPPPFGSGSVKPPFGSGNCRPVL